MAQSTEGLVAIGDYAGNDDTAGDAIDVLLALIADPDSTSTSGAQAGGGFLDEMSPAAAAQLRVELRSEEHTSELQSIMRISYAVFCLQKKKQTQLILYLYTQHTSNTAQS